MTHSMHISEFMAAWGRRGFAVEYARVNEMKGDEELLERMPTDLAPDSLALIVRYEHPLLPQQAGTIKTVYFNASTDDSRWTFQEIGQRLTEEIK